MTFDDARCLIEHHGRSRALITSPDGSEDATHFSVWEAPPADGIVLVGTPVWFVEKSTSSITFENPMYCDERLAAMTPVTSAAAGSADQ